MSEKEPHLQDEVIEALKAAWIRHPDMRLTQLIINAVAPSDPCSEVYGCEDGKLIKLLNRLR